MKCKKIGEPLTTRVALNPLGEGGKQMLNGTARCASCRGNRQNSVQVAEKVALILKKFPLYFIKFIQWKASANGAGQ